MADKLKKPNKISTRLVKLIDAFCEMFDLNGYDFISSVLKNDDEEGTACRISIDEKYHRVNLILFPVFFTIKLEEQRECILHEFCHSIPWGMFSLLNDLKDGKHVTSHQIKEQNERTTSRISHFLDALLDGQYKSKRKAYAQYLNKK